METGIEKDTQLSAKDFISQMPMLLTVVTPKFLHDQKQYVPLLVHKLKGMKSFLPEFPFPENISSC